MKVRFLVDENLSPRLQLALRRTYAELDVLRVGDSGAPPLGTLDPDLLRYLEMDQRMLITDNRVSMPVHVAVHNAAGGHHWGIMTIRAGASMGQLVSALALVWEASAAEEWIDRMDWIPF